MLINLHTELACEYGICLGTITSLTRYYDVVLFNLVVLRQLFALLIGRFPLGHHSPPSTVRPSVAAFGLASASTSTSRHEYSTRSCNTAWKAESLVPLGSHRCPVFRVHGRKLVLRGNLQIVSYIPLYLPSTPNRLVLYHVLYAGSASVSARSNARPRASVRRAQQRAHSFRSGSARGC